MSISVSVPIKTGYIQGRNGLTYINRLRIWGIAEHNIYIEGISAKRNISVNGGFGYLTAEEMDELAREWLKARGLQL